MQQPMGKLHACEVLALPCGISQVTTAFATATGKTSRSGMKCGVFLNPDFIRLTVRNSIRKHLQRQCSGAIAEHITCVN